MMTEKVCQTLFPIMCQLDRVMKRGEEDEGSGEVEGGG